MEILEPLLIIIAVFQLFRNKIAGPLLIMLCMFNSFNIIGNNISTIPFTHHYTDDGFVLLILLIFSLSFRSPQPQIDNFSKLKRGIIVFILFIIAAIIIDIGVNNMHMTSIIRTVRGWVCLPIIWFVKYIKPSEVKKLLNYMLTFTIVLSVLFIISTIIGSSITGATGMGDERAPIPWPPTLLVFILLINNYYKIPSNLKWLCVAIIVTLLVLSGSRSLFIVYLLSFLITAFIKDKKMTLKKIFFSFVSVIFIGAVFTTDNILSRRFSETTEDFGGLQRSNAVVEGNVSFRFLLLSERMKYINSNPQFMLFGIGFIPEDGLHKQLFKIGLVSKKDKRIIQLDTADIAWAPLFLRYGYAGTLLYVLLFYIPAIAAFSRYRKRNVASYSVMLYLLLNLVIVSFTYSFIASSYFWLLPLIMLTLCGEEDKKKE